MIENLPKRLRALRKLKCLDNEGFAKHLGVSKDTLKNWLGGRFGPSIEHVDMLEELFEKEGV